MAAPHRLVYWRFVDPNERTPFLRGLPYRIQLRGRTPPRMYVNPSGCAVVVVRVGRRGYLNFNRYGLWTPRDLAKLDKEFPAVLVSAPRISRTGVQKPKTPPCPPPNLTLFG